MITAPKSNVVPMKPQAPPINPTMLAMAAAGMHAEGRLFKQAKPSKAQAELQPKVDLPNV